MSGYGRKDGEENANHISVYPTLQRGPYDDILSWPFKKTVKVTLLNQLEDRFHHVDTTRFKHADEECTRIEPGAQSATGWGEPKFITHADIHKCQKENCQYLKDDCLFFKVELQ